MEEIVPVKVQPLLADAFKAYGTVIEGEDLGYPETEEGRVGIEKLRLRFRPGADRIEQLAIHFSYNQTFIPLSGSMILVVAPAPSTRKKPASAQTRPDEVTFMTILVTEGTFRRRLRKGTRRLPFRFAEHST